MFFEDKTKIGDYEINTIVTGGHWSENCYLVRHIQSDELILVDPGDDAGRIREILLLKRQNLKGILITHAHHDHVGAVAALYQHFKVPCYLHKDDSRLIRQAHTYALVFCGKQIEPFVSASLCENGEVLMIGRQSINVLHTPGHTAGSSCFSFRDFVFTGDTILYQHIGRTDVPGSDLDQLKTSVTYLLDNLAEDLVVFPGHGRIWSIGEANAWWREAALSAPQYKRFGGIG